MSRKILILGASYGSLLGTKLLMAGHDVTLVCRKATADLINAEGTEVRIKLRDEDEHRAFHSAELPGTLDALTPSEADPAAYDLVALAMSEPQYGTDEIRRLMKRVAAAKVPCLSIMNMPPLPYLKRIEGLDAKALAPSFNSPEVWDGFEPGLVTLCSPDPQAFRPPETAGNVLHVGLPTNFKSAPFEDPAHTAMLKELEEGIEAIRVDGKDVPVKLRVYDSLFVPFAKWSMLLTGNYRCVLPGGAQPIREAVHNDIIASEQIYKQINQIVVRLGADEADQVPFIKYAKAAQGLLKPSSAARAIEGGTSEVERVDMLVKLIADQFGIAIPAVEQVVTTVNARLEQNRRAAA
ncbi:ketopantoate reductase family protein [Poseidonocella sedimentorum]|uniref:Ketopantoate reductase n=1 Tax=Poseidonocella sedimentorum TaxID=871652 RepID=A0A1I6EKF8_9RHOB|nr:2-dehydropantoate 2-reductase N-terminal domain-containing protein [Poseidonocella sedimentorum]SFR18220.1 Ketopantoate reductase [Poseidonocella sedimentorum]